LDPVLAHLPVLEEIDPHGRIRLIQWHVIDQAKAMDHPGGAVVSCSIRDPSGLLRSLHLLEQLGMIAFFDPEEIAKIVGLEGLEMRGMGTQTVFGDDELQVGGVVVQLGHQAFGGIAFTIIVVHPIWLHNRFRQQRNHGASVRMHNGGPQHLRKIGDRTGAVNFLQTRWTVNRLGGKIPRPIESQSIVLSQKRQRFTCLTALELSKNAVEQGTSRLR
jgi:hypothetical protein